VDGFRSPGLIHTNAAVTIGIAVVLGGVRERMVKLIHFWLLSWEPRRELHPYAILSDGTVRSIPVAPWGNGECALDHYGVISKTGL